MKALPADGIHLQCAQPRTQAPCCGACCAREGVRSSGRHRVHWSVTESSMHVAEVGLCLAGGEWSSIQLARLQNEPQNDVGYGPGSDCSRMQTNTIQTLEQKHVSLCYGTLVISPSRWHVGPSRAIGWAREFQRSRCIGSHSKR